MDEVQEKLKVFYDQQEKAAKELRKKWDNEMFNLILSYLKGRCS